MMTSLLDFLSAKLDKNAETPDSPRTDAVQLSTAALLVEMARADFDESSLELDEVKRLLAHHFSLGEAESAALLQDAQSAADRTVSLYRFTHLIHEKLTISEKQSVIELLWRVALADSHLNKHEDALVHKVAELIYVPLSDLMRIKAQVKAQTAS